MRLLYMYRGKYIYSSLHQWLMSCLSISGPFAHSTFSFCALILIYVRFALSHCAQITTVAKNKNTNDNEPFLNDALVYIEKGKSLSRSRSYILKWPLREERANAETIMWGDRETRLIYHRYTVEWINAAIFLRCACGRFERQRDKRARRPSIIIYI